MRPLEMNTGWGVLITSERRFALLSFRIVFAIRQSGKRPYNLQTANRNLDDALYFARVMFIPSYVHILFNHYINL